MLAALFAGDPRVWRGAALLAVPSVLLIAFYCLQPRDYYTGTDNVEAGSYVVRTSAKQTLCIPGLQIPADTARLRLQLRSPSGLRPAIRIALAVEGSGKVRRASLAPVAVAAHHAGAAVFSIPALPSNPSGRRPDLAPPDRSRPSAPPRLIRAAGRLR